MLGLSNWLKGTPIGGFAKSRVYIVEFWAIGAPACKRSAPLLSELQDLYNDKGLTVIGVSVMGPGGQPEAEAYVKRAGDRMSYSVAYDATGDVARRFMQATLQNSIPVSYVVDREGRLAWFGHTLDGVERVAAQVVAGAWDAPKAKADSARRAAADWKSRPFISRLEEEFSANQSDKALVTMDLLVQIDPPFTADWAVTKFGYLLLERKDAQAAYAYAATVADGAIKDNVEALKAIAWMTLAEPGVEKRDVALAKRLAQRADTLSGHADAGVLDTLAKALFESGDAVGAINVQKHAVELCVLPSQKRELQLRLSQYTAGQK
jgi:thiol-disulfide isomerase/thioredoxin